MINIVQSVFGHLGRKRNIFWIIDILFGQRTFSHPHSYSFLYWAVNNSLKIIGIFVKDFM